MAGPLTGNPIVAAREARAAIDLGDDDTLVTNAALRSINIDYSQKRFLVIDAVQEMRSAMNNTLSSFGVTKIDYAHRATEAVGMIKRGDYDIFLCDFDLGRGHDGLHLLEEIKMHNLLKPSALFIIVTGERRAKLVISAAELAPDSYVLKPFTGEQLKQRLDRLYARKREFQSLDAAMLSQDYFKALAECNERIKQRDPFMLDYLKMKGRIALNIGDNQMAKETYEAVLAMRDLAWARMGLGKALFELKQYDEARTLFQELLAENSRIMEAYDWLARIHSAEHHHDEAQKVLAQAVELSPAVVSRQKKLGEVALKNGDYETAAKSFRETISLAKYSFWRDAGDYVSLSKAQLGAGDAEEALKTAAEVRREFRADPKAEMLATVVECKATLRQGQQERAHQLLTKARRQFEVAGDVPDNFALELAEVCYQLGDDADGNQIVQKLLRNHHEDSAVLERIATMYESVDRAELGQRLIEENAQVIVAVNNEAVRMAQSGNLEGAVEKFVQAVNEMPTNVPVMLNAVNALLAIIARKGWDQRYMTLANEYLERVASLQPASVKYLKLKEAYTTTRRRFKP